MIIVEPSVELLGFTVTNSGAGPSKLLERSGRVCWKSEDQITADSSKGFCERVLRQFGHESVAEHASATMNFVTDRIVSHQIVRHRIAAYSQESTHYLNYTKGRHDRQIRVVKPHDLMEGTYAYAIWVGAMLDAETSYFKLIEDCGLKHYEARYVLPMGLKTELVATYNMRTWRHVINKRTELNSAGKPVNTPEVHHLMSLAKRILAELAPEIFPDWVQA